MLVCLRGTNSNILNILYSLNRPVPITQIFCLLLYSELTPNTPIIPEVECPIILKNWVVTLVV